jgi:penicillin-binding protein 2
MYDSRKYIFQAIIIIIGFVFLSKLFAIQVISSEYREAAESNIVMEVIEYPFRGLIHDRNGEQIVVNDPEFDLYVVPKNVKVKDTATFCSLFNINQEEFVQKIKNARKYSYVKPSLFVKQIPLTEYGRIQDFLVDYQGFEIRARTTRSYPQGILANALGYIAEISKTELDEDEEKYYRQGDYIGKSGLEAFYEKDLRGRRGKKFKLKNVNGIEKGDFKDGEYDTLAVPGLPITSTIDLDIQMYAEKLLAGKVGSLVAIEPATGEILAIVSTPFYDPNLLSGREFGRNFSVMQSDTLVPLFNRPVMAMYPPGSIFKTVQALIALEQGVVDPNELIYVDNTLIGDHAPPGLYDLHDAIKFSSNNYFFKTFRKIINHDLDPNTYIDSRMGLERWQEMVMGFGLGTPLGIDIPNEKGGQIPGADYYNRVYGENRWKFSTIASLSIGQGEMLLSPLQMANIAAIMANRGYYYTPHIVKSIGDSNQPLEQFQIRNEVGISPEHYDIIINAMEDALKGTAWRAVIPDVTICGKTGTVENPHGEDHSVFMAFAPKENPQIAISVYVENSGWGGRAAATTASLVVEKYLKGEVSRIWLEDYVLKGEFLD